MSQSDAEPLLHENPGHAIVRPPLKLELAADDDLPGPPALTRTWVRMLLILVGLGWVGIFAIAFWLNPYQDGRPLMEATHRQLGLPACNFKVLTGVPCPSCGMTTSFALLMHGDVANSLRANFAGALLALFGLAYIPWSLASMWRGRWLGTTNVEAWFIRIVFAWVALMLLRWAGILAWMQFSG